MADPIWEDVFGFIGQSKITGCIVPPLYAFDSINSMPYQRYREYDEFDLFILHKDFFNWFSDGFLDYLLNETKIVLANEVFVLFSRVSVTECRSFDIKHIDSLRDIIELSRREKKYDKTLAFLHIPKSAGTSLFRLLSSQFKNHLHIAGGNGTLEVLEKDFNKYNLIGGHAHRGLLSQKLNNRNNNIVWLTMLREPIERFYSYVAHARKANLSNRSPHMLALKNMKIIDYLKSPLSYETLHCSLFYLSENYNCKFETQNIQEVSENVLNFLAQDNVFFGFQDKYTEYTKIISKFLIEEHHLTNLKENIGTNYDSISEHEKNESYDLLMEKMEVSIDFHDKAIELYKRKYANL